MLIMRSCHLLILYTKVKQQNENLNFMNMYLCCVVVATIQILKWHESQACESIVNRLCKLLLAL